MHRAPTLLPLRRALARRATAAAAATAPTASATSIAGAVATGAVTAAPSSSSLLLPQRRRDQQLQRVGASGLRMQSSVAASSVAEPVAPGGGAAAEEEEGQAAAQQRHQQGPNGHHSYAAADASSAVAVEVPVGAEALEPEPPPPEEEESAAAAAAEEATHGVYPGENVLPFTSELRVLRPEGVSLQTVLVGVGSTVVPSPPFNPEPPTNAHAFQTTLLITTVPEAPRLPRARAERGRARGGAGAADREGGGPADVRDDGAAAGHGHHLLQRAAPGAHLLLHDLHGGGTCVCVIDAFARGDGFLDEWMFVI